ncbi:MAG TPA: tetratricopeptide repeat protein [Candidatus Polarisedimenticolia bacterium]|nr:tetratricopeptide repeat protein [Candidatus Polarisedimenticolia bacterium]
MSADRREALRRLGRFLGVLTAVWLPLQLLVWPRVQPLHTAAVTWAADRALEGIERGGRVTRLRAKEGVTHVFSLLREDGAPAVSLSGDVLHFNTVLCLALALAWPGLRAGRRAAAAAAVVACLFVIQTVVLLVQVEHQYAVSMLKVSERNYGPLERRVHQWLHDTGVYWAVQLVPAIVLMTLYVRHGFGPRAGTARRTRPADRRALAAMAAAAVLLAIVSLALNAPKVRARQAEHACAEGFLALGRGTAALASGQPEQGAAARAEGLFRRAVGLNPDFPEAHEGLGQTLLMLGRPEEAAASLAASLALRPAAPLVHVHLGNALFEMERPAEAESHFREALRALPGHRAAGMNLAVALKQQGRRDEYEAALRNVIEHNPADREAHLLLVASMLSDHRGCGALPYLVMLGRLGPGPGAERLPDVAATLESLRRPCGEAWERVMQAAR